MSASAETPQPTSSWEAVAYQKLVHVLGPVEGLRVFREAMSELRLDRLATAADLLRFADVLASRDGFVRTLGAVLRTHAVLRSSR